MSDSRESPSDIVVEQLISRGTAAWSRDDYESALEDFLAVLDVRPGFPDIQNKAGLCLALLDRPDEALEHFEQALELSDTYAEAHLNRALILNVLGRFDEAEAAFKRAGELDRRNSGRILSEVGNEIAITHAKLGDLYTAAEKHESAAREYEKGLKVRPDYLDIRAKLAEALIALGQDERAKVELEEILVRNPGFTTARLRLGVVHKRQGDTEKALEEWRRCAEERPDDSRVQAYLASVKSVKGSDGD